jgi:uncharacterized protein (TIGR00251 family)
MHVGPLWIQQFDQCDGHRPPVQFRGIATLSIHVVPNAKIDKIVGEHGGAIKIKLRASAVEGKANVALISFLADRLNIRAQTVVLLRGQKSRDKLVRIDGLSEEDVRRRLL